MITALDSSVILDVITNDPQFADRSEVAIREAISQGGIVIGECVLAEIAPALPGDSLSMFLADWNIGFIPSSKEAAIEAGRMFHSYLLKRNEPRRVVPDFLIGSHAKHHADRLLARDRGYYRDYFRQLNVINPSS